MEYLKVFDTETQYDAYAKSDEYKTPNVSLVAGETVKYNIHDYSNDYFTIEALENGSVTVPATTGGLSYKLNNGEWQTVETDEQINVQENDKIQVKAAGGVRGTTASPFQSTGNVNVYGNLLSLVGGDDFKTVSSMPASGFTYAFEGTGFKVVSAENLILPDFVSNYCYNGMFYGCTSLTTAPELPATTLANSCYATMFYGCTSLATAPELPATTLAESCYAHMFNGCSSLTTAPELPARTVSTASYIGMFSNCTALTTAPELPATTVSEASYNIMFSNCTSLTTAPSILPATTLAPSCYSNMFSNCTALTTAPELPATTLVPACYTSMFQNCSSLNYVKFMAISTSQQGMPLSTACMSNWLAGTASNGTAVINPDFCLGIPASNNFIPTGWVAVKESGNPEPEYFEPFTLDIVSTGTIVLSGSIKYSLDGGETWIANQSTTLNVDVNDSIQIKVNGNGNFGNPVAAASTAYYNIKGNILSLKYESLYPYVQETSSSEFNSYVHFGSVFRNATKIVDASELLLPFTDLTKMQWGVGGEMGNMFEGCTSLTAAPALPATALTNNCYWGMFSGCTSLITAPSTLPATALTDSCYREMFGNCTSLTSAPTLSATALTYSCYWGMFKNCSSLTTAPALPATALTQNCYYEMFMGCTSLATSPTLSATTLADSCYLRMFNGCTSLTTAPELPATTLANGCYWGMFQNCSSLNYIKCLATDISASNCTGIWVSGVASTGTFVKDANMTDWTTGDSGIPSNWTVQDAS